MNIFKILSNGDGRIKEPNVSAFLAYLLDPSQSHGLEGRFLEMFIKPLIFSEKSDKFNLLKNPNEQRVTDLSIKSKFSINIDIEKPVNLTNSKRRDIDIVIEIYVRDSNSPAYAFCVENKIQDGAVNTKQLIDEFIGINNLYDTESPDNVKPHIGFIFITPIDSVNVKSAFQNFLQNQEVVDIGVSASHLVWKSTEDDNSIFKQLSSLLDLENKGQIDPIQEYTKHTLKSFLNFIITDFKSYQEEKKEGDKFKRNRLSENGYWELNEGKSTIPIAKKIKRWVESKIGNRGKILYSPTHMSIYVDEIRQYSKQGVFLQVTLKYSNTKLFIHIRKNPNIPFTKFLEDFRNANSIDFDINNLVEEKRPGVFTIIISNNSQYEEIGEKIIEFSFNQLTRRENN